MILYRYLNYTSAVGSRALLSKAIKDYCTKKGIHLESGEREELLFQIEPKGRPFIDLIPQVNFSVSHTRNVWLCGIQDRPLGIDLEPTDGQRGLETFKTEQPARFEKIADRFFTEDEQKYVKNHGIMGFYAIWVRKEAFVKYRGTGISEGLSDFSVVSGDWLASRLNELYLEEVSLGKGILAAYCSTVPLNIEEIVDLGNIDSKMIKEET